MTNLLRPSSVLAIWRNREGKAPAQGSGEKSTYHGKPPGTLVPSPDAQHRLQARVPFLEGDEFREPAFAERVNSVTRCLCNLLKIIVTLFDVAPGIYDVSFHVDVQTREGVHQVGAQLGIDVVNAESTQAGPVNGPA